MEEWTGLEFMDTSFIFDPERRGRSYVMYCEDVGLLRGEAVEVVSDFLRKIQILSPEGDPLHWLACSVYAACRRKVVSTMDRRETRGNYISLTRLLRSAKLSLIQFFNKIKKWADMDNLSSEFRDKVNLIERNFNVTTVIYNKFEPMFWLIFKAPAEETPKQPRSRKQRARPCGTAELYSFTWKVFIQAKGCYPPISDDLVNSYHLLLCVVDWIFGNVVIAHKENLLNPNFEGYSKYFKGPESKGIEGAPCILDILCKEHDGLCVEAQTIKEHHYIKHTKRLVDKKVLRGVVDSTVSGVLDVGVFEENCKAVDKSYEEHILAVGDFDERIFLGKFASDEIGTPAKVPMASGEFSAKLHASRPSDLKNHLEQAMTFAPATPLTGRRYLPPQQQARGTPVKAFTEEVRRLQAVLFGCKRTPSDDLLVHFGKCSESVKEFIQNAIEGLGKKFEAALSSGDQSDVTKRKLFLADTLFYKLIEAIVDNEIKKLHVAAGQTVNLTSLLMKEVFITSLYAVCLEIVIFSYNFHRNFPWLLCVLELDAFHVYQVIELVIKAEDGFSRELVKHLNFMEETILESQVWKEDSGYIWTLLEERSKSGQSLGPSCSEVALPPLPGKNPITSPILGYPATRKIFSISQRSMDMLSSPGIPAAERFSSPSPAVAKRQLFPATTTSDGTTKVLLQKTTLNKGVGTPVYIPVQLLPSTANRGSPRNPVPVSLTSASSGHQVATVSTVSSGGGGSMKITLCGSPVTGVQAQQARDRQLKLSKTAPAAVPSAAASSATPAKKTSPLFLFYRKVYHLASTRLRYLCDHLFIDDHVVVQKIWTALEFCMMYKTEVLHDRHLDQVIMCTVYAVLLRNDQSKSFPEIIKCYRQQPQAQRHVYRSVLLEVTNAPVAADKKTKGTSKSKAATDDNVDDSLISGSAIPPPSLSSQPNTPVKGDDSPQSEAPRGDLIQFYNSVYVPLMQKFINKLTEGTAEKPPLSPLPTIRHHPVSPRKVSNNVFISPHKNQGLSSLGVSNQRRLQYTVNKSPAKDLTAINSVMELNAAAQGTSGLTGKRVLLTTHTDAGDSPTKRAKPSAGPLVGKLENFRQESDKSQ